MNVATVSCVRNATRYLPWFFVQLRGLRNALAARGHTLRMIVVEGDSTDDTWALLRAEVQDAGLTADLVQHHHGGPPFGSVEHPERWRQLAAVYNTALDRLTEADDWVLHVEADLLWQPWLIEGLLSRLRDVDAVAPLVMLRPHWFYDTFGFRTLDDRRFWPHPPYHPDGLSTRLTEIGAAGSCVAVRGEYARAARWSPEDVSVGWWRDMRAAGACLWLDPMTQVEHP